MLLNLYRKLTEYLYKVTELIKNVPLPVIEQCVPKFSGSNNKVIWSGDNKTGHVPLSESNNNLEN
jgi:hypothetical protein